jgi:hypothetical protein
VFTQVGQDGCQVAGALDGGTGCRLDVDADFCGDNVGDAGLAQSGRPVKKDMVDRFTPPPGRGDSYLQVFLRFILPDKFGQAAGPETAVERRVLFAGLAGYYACYFASPPLAVAVDGNSGGVSLLYLRLCRRTLPLRREILRVRRAILPLHRKVLLIHRRALWLRVLPP